MFDSGSKGVLELMKKPGNDVCADCGAKGPEWASYNIGIFLCSRCAGIHRGMGTHISKVKHVRLDRWEDSQIQRMREVGNLVAKAKYEKRVPPCYRIPVEGDQESLLEEWICAKYLREEFSRPERQAFMAGHMEGFLMKRGKEDPKYYPRKFTLSEVDDTLKYYVDERKDPKAVMRVSDINVSFSPAKLQKKNSFQISYWKDGSTRHLYVYHDDPQTIVNWYNAIRCTKLHRLQIAFPTASQAQLVSFLTKDFLQEGWLWKTGPRPTDAYKKRWFTLDQRKFMYHEDPLSAHPKGEVFLGHMSEGYSVRVGVPAGVRDQGHSFTLRTPGRWYYLAAEESSVRDKWIQTISSVLEIPLSTQDNAFAARLVRKRGVTSSLNIFSSR
ncbi:arf-GAP with dual PH domain-containing protein 1-like [Cimex lectularius]|uniref:Arf-GAP with dual PH domain-containing protein 1-like n=1 Tax=Cimex lectularius TaxID=79782 RepID=A0A8I6RGG0_CIMLE|nr:arf-GAP with dual PH domain-containing protein 1-like [Cimex lectularius]